MQQNNPFGPITTLARSLFAAANAAAARSTLGAQAALNALTAAQSFNDQPIERFSQSFVTVTGATYTLQASDNGRTLEFSHTAAITLTIPAGLPAGFECKGVQMAAGAVVRSAGAGVTITNRQGHTRSAGTWAVFAISQTSTPNTFVFYGDTAA